jgi:hypothetical protein
MKEYDRLLRHGPTGQEKIIPEGSRSVHTRHCFEVLRQSVLCHMDMTLEGSIPHYEYGSSGFGHAHVCQNGREALHWMEANAANGPPLI